MQAGKKKLCPDQSVLLRRAGAATARRLWRIAKMD